MKELSLHILDIVQNSIVAGASSIEIDIDEDFVTNTLSIRINDNGKGIPPDMLSRIIDPYTTSRTTRKVGMGLPLLNDACRFSGGKLQVNSTPKIGTEVVATLGLDHIDRQPLGDIQEIILLLISANPTLDFIYQHSINGNKYVFDTKEVKEALDGLPINSPDVIRMLREMIEANLEEL
ncbi:MAG: ATP-binding protein [Bacteroidales bacterium]